MIILLQGTDITEAFETHHMNLEKSESVLKKYRVREATLPRNIKLTFNDNGFYKTLKRRVNKKIDELNVTGTRTTSNVSEMR